MRKQWRWWKDIHKQLRLKMHLRFLSLSNDILKKVLGGQHAYFHLFQKPSTIETTT